MSLILTTGRHKSPKYIFSLILLIRNEISILNRKHLLPIKMIFHSHRTHSTFMLHTFIPLKCLHELIIHFINSKLVFSKISFELKHGCRWWQFQFWVWSLLWGDFSSFKGKKIQICENVTYEWCELHTVRNRNTGKISPKSFRHLFLCFALGTCKNPFSLKFHFILGTNCVRIHVFPTVTHMFRSIKMQNFSSGKPNDKQPNINVFQEKMRKFINRTAVTGVTDPSVV